jgi:hypothetical protein
VYRVSTNLIIVWTPAHYFEIIKAHSRTTELDTLYVGDNFRALVTFLGRSSLLKQPPQSHSITRPTAADDGRDFALVYILKDLDGSPKPTPLRQPLPDLLHTTADSRSDGALMFLMGYPSPDWLLQLGAAYHIDPEFFRLHLDFAQSEIERSLEQPRLPSYRKSVFQLHVTSIGYHVPPLQLNIQQRRASSAKDMAAYLKSMQNSIGWKQGDSIIRSYAAHDDSAYSIQQAITVCFCKARSQRIAGNGSNWICS